MWGVFADNCHSKAGAEQHHNIVANRVERTGMAMVELEAHRGQIEFLKDDSRFKVLACGRRWGKTTACIMRAARELIEKDDPLVWWVAPVYKQADIGFKKFLKIYPEELIENVHRSRRRIETVDGGAIEFLSAENPDHLRGEGVDVLIIDEAAEVSQYAWENALRPTLTDDASSQMVAISTPKGHNWFRNLFTRGNDPDEPAYQSWNFESMSNPFISHEDIREAERTLPDRVYRQEYLAEFIDDEGTVFKRVRDRIVDSYNWREEEGRGPYTTGVDFARHQDWTVIITLDSNGTLVNFDRVQKVSWDHIENRVLDAYQEYPGPARLDATRDNKIIQDLEAKGVEAEPVTFSGKNKREMIENLVTMVEKEQLRIPDIPPLVNELEIFEFDVSRTGNVRYQAPEGYHDDCVDALALAARAADVYNATW